jgi:peptidoglycan/LPS O-acetylase OafA/YrhL
VFAIGILVLGDTSNRPWVTIFFVFNYMRYFLEEKVAAAWDMPVLSGGIPWSLCIDFHMYIVLPLLLLVMHRTKLLSVKSLLVVAGAGVVYRWRLFTPGVFNVVELGRQLAYFPALLSKQQLQFLSQHYDWHFNFDLDKGVVSPYIAALYHPTHARFSSFLVGAAVALAIARLRKQSSTAPASWLWSIVSHACLLPALATIALPMLPPTPESPPVVVSQFLTASIHFLPSLAFGYVLYVSLVPPQHRFAIGWLRAFLSLPLWYPVAVLSFGIFLFHFRIAHYVFLWWFRPTMETLTHGMVVQVWLITLALSALFAVPLHLLVEKPAMQLFPSKSTQPLQKKAK